MEPYASRAPHPRLRGLVSYVGYHHVEPEPGVHHGLPSTSLTVIVAFDEPIDVGWLDERQRGRHDTVVSGLHTGPAVVRFDRVQHGVQLALTPRGARQLLGVPAGALAGVLVPLPDVLGAELAAQAYEAMAVAATWGDRFDVLERHLLGLVDRHPLVPARPELDQAWRLLARSRGAIRVESLAREVGWSRRHLTGQFTREFGLSPKQVARVVRFEHARRLLPRLGATGLAHVAAAAGYADQQHLNREWRALAGCTPTEWMRQAFPFVQDAARATG